MNLVKTHLSLILPLLFMMFAFEFVWLVNTTTKHYEKLLNKDYNIIITSSIDLDEKELKTQIPSLLSLEKLSAQSLIERLKNDISQNNLNTLEKTLPKFYSLKLNDLPSQSELNAIKERLSKVPLIQRVETFSKTHDKIYTLLVLVQFVLWFFCGIVILLSLVLLFKQMRIWLFEHTQRVEIMCLFGAPFWFRSFILYKIVFVDCLIAFLILLIFFTQFFSLPFIQNAFKSVDIIIPEVNFYLHLSIIFALVLILCLLCVNSVMFKVKK